MSPLGRAPLFLALLLLASPASGAEEIHVVAWGDSLTSGEDWLVHLGDVGHPEWTYEDHGKAGEKSWEAAEGISETQSRRRFRNWLDGASSQPGDVIVFMWGTNDVRRPSWNDPAMNPRHNHQTTSAALAQLVSDAVGAGYPVVLAMPPPILASPDGHTEEEAALFDENLRELLAPVVAAVAAGHPGARVVAVSVFDHWEALPQWPHLDYYALSPEFADGIHPGTEPAPSGQPGNLHVAEPLAQAIAAAAAPGLPSLAPSARFALAAALLTLGALCAARRTLRAAPG